MKLLFEKKLNKLLIGAFIGTAILGFGGFSMSPKGKKFFSRFKKKLNSGIEFLKSGVREMLKSYKSKN